MLTRREFLQQTAACGAATALAGSWASSLDARAVTWPIGCFNRPWTTWSFDDGVEADQAGRLHDDGAADADEGGTVHRRGCHS